MASQDSSGPLLLLEDYGRSVARRAADAGSGRLEPARLPIWLLASEFPARLRWQFEHGSGTLRPAPGAAAPEFLAERFDAVRRYREAPGSGVWPADSATALRMETAWSARRPGGWALAGALHAVALAFLLIPAAMQLETTKPADWDTMRITLMTPELDDLPPLDGQSDVPGDGEGGFRGLPRPPASPAPEPVSLPEVAPAAEDVAEVPQPIEPEEPPEPEEPEEEPALEPEPEPEEPEAPAALSPDPGEFQRGRELAQARDPRLLPMPAAPSRKRAALQLEDPKARMPSRPGEARLGTLELAARSDQFVQGAIQDMIRGGGGRQVVGDGIGGALSEGVLPSGPSKSGSVLELLSDPRGVDFRPYLTQILAAVRRNWFAVIPESARMGMTRGRTLIQFSVARNGTVPKLVIAKTSGAPPLDRAAVAGISASNPFPPLPGEYLGQDIRLQFTFLYNIGNP